MWDMFNQATKFNQPLCLWLQYTNFPEQVYTSRMFTSSACPNKSSPSQSYVCQSCFEELNDGNLKIAADLWNYNEEEAEAKYGSIEVWNLSKVTKLDQLFYNKQS